LKSETVLITGASSGIGCALARCFAADGSKLILVARRRQPMEQLAGQLHSTYRTQSEVFPLDLSQPQAASRIFRHLETNGTRVDVLVNNAGIGGNGAFVKLPLDWQSGMVQVNVAALVELTRLLLPRMLEKRQGGILNVASTAAFQPGPGMAVYYATKAFVLSFSEALAEELSGTGVSITALCPGPTETNFAEASNARHAPIFNRLAMSADAVARIGHSAFRAGRVVAVAGARNRFLAFSVRFAPRVLARKVAGRLNRATYSKSSVA
jgi:uncharacterized protein